jgi:GT2 family glycosyltransferase
VAEVDVPAPDGLAVRRGSGATNLGVAGGRNAAAKLATGDLLLFLDDDAVLRPGAVRHAVDALTAADRIGAVAFNVVDPATGEAALWYHPYAASEWSTRGFEASTVIGCGHLVRREVFEALGGYWDGFFREMEEVDFSWRLLDAGWAIRYEPLAVVEHVERTEAHFAQSLASNLLMTWRLLPAGLALRHTTFLLSLFTVRALRRGSLGSLADGLRRAAALAPRSRRERSPLNRATVRYLRQVHACQGPGKRLRWSLRPLAPPPPSGAQPLTELVPR